MQFNINSLAANSNARSGLITTDHGQIPTPIFMPVGTVGSVKGINHRELENDIDAKIILGNTY
ncbi:MAG: tRNA-guanine transglycosylase, partial [Bacteroidales bacterium]|nr:tRNA-guanine transglycosylase [Bacteroidales bacterium]